jgi:outer membrane receptor for ferrienterochelin and colicins
MLPSVLHLLLTTAFAQQAPPPAPEPEAAAPEPEEKDDPFEDIEEVVVTGTRSAHKLGDSPVATEVIDRETIEQSGAISAADLLERATGVRVNRDVFGSAISMQGLDPTHTLVLIDGQRMVGRKDGTLDLSRISAERIERIEIVKGPGSTMYGSDAMGGVINIITRGPRDNVAQAELRGGGLATLDTSVGLELANYDVGSHTTIAWHTADAYDLDPETLATDGVAYDAIEFSEKLFADVTDDLRVTASASYLARQTTAIEEQSSGATFNRDNWLEEFQGAITPKWVVSETATLSFGTYLTVFRDQFFYDQYGSNQLDVYEDNRQTLGEIEVQYDQVLGPHLVSVGAEGFREWYVSPRLGTGEGTRNRAGVYLQDQWSLVPKKLQLLPGVRVDSDSQFGSAVNPRLAVAWFATKILAIRGNVGRGFRAPDFKELYLLFENPAAGYVVQGNPELLPERSLGFTLGADLDLERLHASAQLFRNSVDDLIIIDLIPQEGFSATQRFGYQNIAQAYTQGVDSSLSLRPTELLNLQGGVQYLVARDVETGDPLPGRPPLSGNFATILTPRRTGLSLSVNGVWNTRRPFYFDEDGDDVIDEVFAAPLLLLDARVAWKVDTIELFAGAENLTDAGDSEYNQLKPRWFYAGMRGRFGGGP